MKINAKFAALAGAAVLAGAGAFAQATDDYNLPKGFKFSSKISSDVIYNAGNMHDDASTRGADANYHSELAGLYQTISISYSSEKFAFALNPKWGLFDWNENLFDSSIDGHKNKSASSHDDLNADDLSFAWKEAKFDIRFSPFDIVDFYLNQDVFTAGSNLLARGKQMGNGNLQGDGVGVILKPIDGLRLAADVPFKISFVSNPNFLNAEYDDSVQGDGKGKHTAGKNTDSKGTTGWWENGYKFRVDLGADYTVGGLTVGGSVVNLVSRADRGYGLYAALKSGAFQANVGYTYKDADNGMAGIDFFDTFGLVRVSGAHLVNASAQAKLGDLTVALDVLTNLVKFGTQSVYDLGAMFKVDYAMVPGKFNLGMKVGAAFDLKADPSGTAKAGYLYQAKKTTKSYGSLTDIAFKNKDVVEGNSISGDYNKKAAIALFLNPNFTYKTGKNTFTGAANLVYFLNGDGSYACKFPVAWTYAF